MGAMAPVQHQRSNAEAVESLRRKLHGYMESAAEAIGEAPARTRSAMSYFRYLVHVRRRLREALKTVRGADSDLHERLLRQAEISYLTKPERFSHLTGRIQLLEAWTSLLIEANEKLANDKMRAQAYAEAARSNAENDSSAVAVASRAALKRWARE